MEIEGTTNFRDHVDLMVLESPAALVLDWWRRLDLTLVDCFGPDAPDDRASLEQRIREDARFGEAVARRVELLRKRRNEVAHESVYLPREEAVAFAEDAFDLIGVFGQWASDAA